MRGISQYVQDLFTAFRQSSELDRFERNELNRIAADAGISVAELRDLSRKTPGSAALLDRRLAVLGLTETANVQPAVLRDLQRVCTQCKSKGRCSHDLDRDPSDPVWKWYCPNAETLLSLR